MGNRAPQFLGDFNDDTNPIIVVGGVEADGTLAAAAYVNPPGKQIISVYGSYEVTCLSPTFGVLTGKRGTSVASPAVAGLIADWLAVDDIHSVIENDTPGTSFAAKVRRFVRDISLTRNPGLPNINTLYNGYRDNPCKLVQPAEVVAREISDDLFSLFGRQVSNDVPVIVNGTIVDPNFGQPVGTMRPHNGLMADRK